MRITPFTLIILLCLNALVAAPKLPKPWEFGQLPTWDAGVRGGIPKVKTKIEIDAEVLSSKTDPAAFIQSIIDSTKAPAAILLPKGTYHLTSPLSLKSGIVLRGQGPKRTILKFDITLPDTEYTFERPSLGSIRFEGSISEKEISLTDIHLKGTTTLKIAEADTFKKGDLIEVFSENDPALLYTDPRWKRPWADRALGQIVSIVSIKANTIKIDTPLRLNFYLELNPRIRKIEPIEEAGVENLGLERIDNSIDSIIGFEGALNCWALNCNSFMAGRGHIWVNHSRFVTVQGNEVHHAFSYDGGGNGYGLVAGNIAVDCLYIDNIAHNLRHSYMAKKGSNGNVFAYNYSHTRRREPEGEPLLCDISLHGHYPYQNLFEGNVVEYVDLADHWGPTGPDTTFFRNRIKDKVTIRDYSHHMRFIGNVIQNNGIHPDITVQNTSLLENILLSAPNDDQPKYEGELPASLIFESKPGFWGDDLAWPSIGPDSDNSQDIVIPAQHRWEKSKKLSDMDS
ncbi:hypothetical protein MLD52_02970 [Puniceicoccaceae bacterium K14]|nr:hypothetical protein [Puniceicoccaceae bacterium K14]